MRLLPGEWGTAAQSLVEMKRRGLSAHPLWSHMLGFALPFAAGALIGCWLLPEFLTAEKDVQVSVAAGILAYCGILIGFGVTLMLFTGRIDRPLEMSYEVLRAYVARTRYLLASQGLTIVVGVATSVVALIWSALVVSEASTEMRLWVGVAVAGLTGVSLARSLLLPMQVYELHEAWLADTLRAKEDQLSERYSAASRSIASSPDQG